MTMKTNDQSIGLKGKVEKDDVNDDDDVLPPGMTYLASVCLAFLFVNVLLICLPANHEQ